MSCEAVQSRHRARASLRASEEELEHDAEKCAAVFQKDHAQSKAKAR